MSLQNDNGIKYNIHTSMEFLGTEGTWFISIYPLGSQKNSKSKEPQTNFIGINIRNKIRDRFKTMVD